MELTYHLVAVVHSDNELLEVPASIRLRQPPVGHHQLEHVPARGVLHHYGQVVRREEDLRCGSEVMMST